MLKPLTSGGSFSVVSVAALLVLGSLLSSPARVVTVGVANGNSLAFFPAVTNISAGDQVAWVWNNTLNTHSTTDTNFWDSGLHPNPFSFTNTFNSAGTFHYICKVHSTFGMTGAVVVAAANLPPTVTVTNPANVFIFSAPASVKLGAAAADSDGSVTNVRFLQGTTVLTNLTISPYFVIVSNLAAGTYAFSAVAADNFGLTATNAITNTVVAPVTVAVSSPTRLASTNFRLAYTANTGLRYVIQRSTNLLSTNWLGLATNTATSSSMTFTDLNAAANPGFYRVGRLPNP